MAFAGRAVRDIMGTMIRGFLRRSWSRTFLTALWLILIGELLPFVVAWFSLDYYTNRWIDNKTAQVMRISQQTASSSDWSLIDRIPIEGKSPIFQRYHQKVLSLSRQYFQKVGSIYLVRIEHGEEYDIDTGDSNFADFGKANGWELRAYESRKPTYTPVPFSDDSGTYLAAYTPILGKGRVVGLVAAEYDSAPLADFHEIVKSVFQLSMVPAILLSLLISYVLANRFAEPIEVVRDIEEVKKQGLGQLKGGKEPWGLTGRQLDVFESLSEDLTNAQIASKLSMSQETVKSHMKNILSKSGLKRWQLIVAARERLAQMDTSVGSV
jgi:DNA-binding CsgD family transcriptional regulator